MVDYESGKRGGIGMSDDKSKIYEVMLEGEWKPVVIKDCDEKEKEKKIVMYTEIHLTEEEAKKLKKWEKETGEDAEEMIQSLVENFVKELEEE
jgi:hypothetical protein